MNKNKREEKLRALLVACLVLFSACEPQSDRAAGAYVAAADAYAQERYAEALEYVRESLRLDARFYQARLLEGKILFFQDRREEAAQVFSKLSARHPEYTEARIWKLRCLVLMVRPLGENQEAAINEAQGALDRELSFNPNDWRVLYLYALLSGNTGDYEKHLAMGRRAETALSDSAKVYLDMALTWRSLELEDRAELYFEKARIVSGGNAIARQILELEGD
jgi:tetratricopeptide (TPR) repeat protein